MTTLKRVNYFDGRLLSAADFQLEQEYHRERQRLQNRLLVGCGVATGLKVSTMPSGKGWNVTVTPGTALDPSGELLNLCETSSLSIKSTAVAVMLYLRYAERPSDDVVATTSDSDGISQPSRIEETCELVLMDEGPLTATKLRPVTDNRPTGVALARLVRTRTLWRVDPKFKATRIR